MGFCLKTHRKKNRPESRLPVIKLSFETGRRERKATAPTAA